MSLAVWHLDTSLRKRGGFHDGGPWCRATAVQEGHPL